MSNLKKGFFQATETEIERARQNLVGKHEGYMNTGQAVKREKTPEEKRYVIMLIGLDSSDREVDHVWLDAIGRTAAYNMTKNIAMQRVADLNNSMIITEGVTLEGAVSLVGFLEHMSRNVFRDESFDVRDYIDIEDDDMATDNNNIPMGVTDSEQVSCLIDDSVQGEDI